MQIAYSQYADQDVVVAAGLDYSSEKRIFLNVTLKVDYRQEFLEPRDIVYSSTDHPELDWTSTHTVLGVLERLGIAVSQQFIADISNEQASASRHLNILYADDDTVLPF